MSTSAHEPARLDVAVHQPGYHRHLYYYYKMAAADVFVRLDSVQYVTREWQNRQAFWRNGHREWLTVPVNPKRQPIYEKRIADPDRITGHWRIIEEIYGRMPYFDTYRERLEEIYHAPWEYLVDLCQALDDLVREALLIDTPQLRSSDLAGVGRLNKGELLAQLCLRARAEISGADRPIRYLACGAPMRVDHYLLQPSRSIPGITHQQEIESYGVEVATFSYKHPVYRQFQLPADHGFEADLSAFDLLFNHGPASPEILMRAGVQEGSPDRSEP